MLMITHFIINHWYIVALFFIVAVLYASVGFGGGSSYLALLALTGFSLMQIRSTALLCNSIVVLGNVFWYLKYQDIDWKKTLPIILCSVPMAFLGGLIRINESYFYITLSLVLLSAACMMLLTQKKKPTLKKEFNLARNTIYGTVIGFVSGLVGIGGGIFLAPLLHLTHWNTSKKIAATASVFILVNSISGLLGQISNPNFSIDWSIAFILMITVFAGGQIGTRLSHKILSENQLKKYTALLVFFVAIRILIKYF